MPAASHSQSEIFRGRGQWATSESERLCQTPCGLCAIALAALLRPFPHLRLTSDALRWRRLTFLRGLEALPAQV
jgi:hypothetical protein